MEKKNKDLSSINSNGWLAGLIDTNGNFNVIIAPRKNTKKIRIQAQFRLELRQYYHRTILSSGGTHYLDIMSILANYLGVNVYNRSRFLESSITYQYLIVADSKKSQNLIRCYLETHRALTSKYLDYLDWCKIIELVNKPNHLTKEEIIKKSIEIKSNMNSKRKLFTWNHLNHFLS